MTRPAVGAFRLEAAQREAAATEGPLRVIAGAGTGKTAVIAERFRRLVAAGADPASVLVMTFTDRAAREMRDRIEQLIGADAPAVGTVHSIALGWLRADGWRVGVPARFRILAGAERWILARELMWRLGDPVLTGDERPDDLVGPALQMLERLKQELVPLRRLAQWAAATDDAEKGELMRACVRLFAAYRRECRRRGLVDFDDLLERSVAMLEGNPAVLAAYRRRYPFVLVDEYQDLNLAQEKLVELIAVTPFVVGDDDQSIYRFRGASRASLERFCARFPAARTAALGRNHRSSRKIVVAAAALIANNPERLAKDLVSTRPGPRVEVWSLADGDREAGAIAAGAAALVRAGMAPGRIAVLCRTNAIARPVADALAAHGLPHVVVGGQGLLDRPEVRDVMAMLRVVLDPTDQIATLRVLTRAPYQLDAAEVIRILRDRGATPPHRELFEELGAEARTLDVRDLFFELMNRTGYLDVATAGSEPSAAARVAANVSRFAERIADYCDANPDHSLAAYMEYLDLVLLSGEDEAPGEPEMRGDAISVMTIHQAKGLEFDAVFVPALVEGRLPQSGRSQRFELPPAVLEPLVRGREDVIAEERRLLYVAMTRARKRLYLSHASTYEGGRRWRESRFLEEIRACGGLRDRLVQRPSPTIQTLPASGEGSSSPSPLTLSYSSIQAYRDCPKQYWFRYEQRLPARQSAEAVQGVILHDVLRRAGEARRSGEQVTAGRLKSWHASAWETVTFPDSRRAPTFRRNGLAQLEAFRAAGGFDSPPELVERDFTAAVDGFTLHGIIDRVDRVEAGWRIVDYKTGRPVGRARRDLQVALYGLGAAGGLGLEPAELEIVYLASGTRVVLDGIPALEAEAKRIAAEAAAGIRSGGFEPRPERRKCRLCPYRLACADAL
ncbi:MAG TPA: ATP-dependent DNA helicase [Candidatus Dormibacteraeota bacterium]|nr:ATP-dependent DNA helicase [Candidatus Dormibacteraeota bacterium]